MKKYNTKEGGFTIVELLVVVGIVGVLSGTAVYALRSLDDPASNGAAQLMTYIKKTRAKALATTNAYRIRPKSDGVTIEAQSAVSCTSATFTTDSTMNLKLPTQARVASTTWSICVTPRGTLSTSENVGIADTDSSKTLQIAMGGGMRII